MKKIEDDQKGYRYKIMKKIIFVLMIMFCVVVTGNVASAHETLYINSNADQTDLERNGTRGKFVIWDYDGFRTEVEMNKDDDYETNYQKGFDFGYAVSSYITQVDGFSLENRNDHVMFMTYYIEGKQIAVFRASAAEMLNEMIRSFMDNDF